MKVLVTGSSGFVGSAVMRHLKARGYEVDGLTRPRDWDPDQGTIDHKRLQGCDAVVHLAGENISSGRWTEAKKKRILESRTRGTRLLAEALAGLSRPPKVLISASAIGFYGDRGSEQLSEASPAGEGFLAEVCKAWEAATQPASKRGIRVVNLRIGIVLSSAGGALPKMLLPFRLGVGGVLAGGQQYMSWITLDDLCRVIDHAMTVEFLSGPVNTASPRPVTNKEFTSMLAGAVRRPALFPVPRVAAHLALGELADALLLASTRVVPGKLLASGFRFEDPDLSFALAKSVPGISTLESSQWIAHPPEDVFPFFASANNLDLLTPKWLQFEIRNPNVEMRPGALINYRLRLHGVPLCWQSEIVDWEPPYRFVDVQRRGPYGLWIHEHRFEPRDGGTLVSDRVRYTVPGGTLVRKLFVEPDLSRIFSYRRARLEEHFA
jgi:uncharacterized protein (TIGR01777 family)